MNQLREKIVTVITQEDHVVVAIRPALLSGVNSDAIEQEKQQ